MIEEKIYVLDDGTEEVIIEKINYNGILYMLLKNNKTEEVKIGFAYNNRLLYIDNTDEDFEKASSLLLEKITKKLNDALK